MQYLNKRVAAICLAAASAFVQAQEATYDFNIPAQSASQVLNALSKQTGLQPFFTEDSVKGVQSPGVKGKFSLREALGKALAGTGLSYQFTAEKAVAIKAVPAEKVAQLATIEVRGETEKGYAVRRAATATKTDTPLMETPASVQVVPNEVMADQRATLLEDALRNVSGVVPAQGLATDKFIIRGFETDREGFTIGYRDGVRSQLRGRLSLANVERVEVLKGPAAMLYGRIEPGGLINLVTKRPQAERSFSIEQQIGSYDEYRTLLDATGTLNSDGTVTYRLNAELLRSNSFRDFKFLDREFVAPSFSWRLSDATVVDLDFIYQNEKTRPDTGIPAVGNRPADISRNFWLGDPYDDFRSRTYQGSINIKHRIDENWNVDARLTYLRDEGLANRQIFPAGPFNQTTGVYERGYFDFPGKTSNQSGTVNLSGKLSAGGLEHNLLFGTDYYQLTDSSSGTFSCCGDPSTPPSINIFKPVYGLPGFDSSLLPPPGDLYSSEKHWWGAYFQDQINIGERWRLLLGGRYDRANQKDNFGIDQTDSEFSPRYGLLYRAAVGLSLYASYTQGFSAANTGRVVSGTPQPERATQYEVGAKFDSANKGLSATISAFNLTKKNVATPATDPLLAALGFVELAGEVESKGIELDVTGQITSALSVIATYSHTDARVTRDRDDGGGAGFTGKRLVGVPKDVASLWAVYDLGTQGVGRLSAGMGVFAASDRFSNRDNTVTMPGYGRVDAMVRYRWNESGRRMTAQLNVGNLFDKDYFASGSGGLSTPGSPRTVVASLRAEF